jgi:hypothetical protein
MASLNLRPIYHLSAGALAYRLCEAKFSAEAAGGVGASTTGFIMNKMGQSNVLFLRTIDKFRDYWEKWKMEPPPPEIIESIMQSPDMPDEKTVVDE